VVHVPPSGHGGIDARWLSQEARAVIATRPPDANGYSPFTDTSDDVRTRRANRLAHMESAHGGAAADLRVSELSRRAYRDLVADCRVRGVPVAFYFTAESPTFRGWYSAKSLETVAAFRRFLSDELGCPVFVPRAADFDEDDFGDGIHMIPRGATKYSRWLADAHLRSWLTQVGAAP